MTILRNTGSVLGSLLAALVMGVAVAALASGPAVAGARLVIAPDRPAVPDLSLGGTPMRVGGAASHARGRSGRGAARFQRPRAAAPAAAVWTVAAGGGDEPAAAADPIRYADAADGDQGPVNGVRALIGAAPVTASDQASVVEVGVTDGPSLGGGAFILLVTRSRSGARSAGGNSAVVTLPAVAWAGQDPLTCMTQAVYFEARGEPLEGQEGVAQVVMNRTRLAQYSSDVCGVVFQGAQRATGCQFSFTCDGAMNRPLQADAWERAQAVAARALDGFVYEPLRDATHFHAGWVNPYWSPSLTRVKQIGGHIFYR